MSEGKIPLLLLPGLLNTADLFAAQIEALSDIADIVVADLTGVDSIAAMAEAVLDQAPWPRFAMAGLSMGGYVAFEILRQAPDRVERVAFLDTMAQPDTPEATERRLGFIRMTNEGKFNRITPILLPKMLHPSVLKDRDLNRRVVAMAEAVGPEAFKRQQTAIMTRPDSRMTLSSIKVPTLVLVGEADVITPPEVMQEIADGVGGEADFMRLSRCGHLSAIERPNAVSHALRGWLLRV